MLAAARKHGLSSRDHSWSSELPPEWDVAKLRRLLAALDQGWSPTAEDRQAGEREWGVLKLSAISHGSFLPSEHKALPPDEAPDPSIEVRPGDVLLTRANTPKLVGDACFVGRTRPGLMFSDLIYRLRFNDSVDPRFVTYWLVSAPGRHQIEVDARGSSQSMVKVSQSHIRAWRVPVPGVVLQRQIVDFLDRETAKIDRLIQEKQRLIELLEEKRTALITQAVTKGLDPDVEMKDSGVEWLGEIPATWETIELRYLVAPHTSITYGIVQAGPDVPDGIPYIRSGDMSGEVLPYDGYRRTSQEIDRTYSRSKVESGDIVVAIRATVGKALQVPDHLEGANLTQGTARVSPGDRIVSRFLFYALNSARSQQRFEALSKGATFREITLEMLRRLVVAVPPLDEQVKIAARLDELTREIGSTLSSVRRAVELLQEYRTVLISAAVTGKIDVREEAA